MLYGIPVNYNGVCDVEQNFHTYFKLLTNKCLSLFKWENLPETVDERFLMTQLILNGKVCWFNHQGRLYALNGAPGGEPNVYYEPQTFIVANPIIGSKTLTIRNKDGSESIDGLDGVLMALTDIDYELTPAAHGGLYGLIYQTAGLLADNISSLNVAQINGRASVAFTADTEALAESAEEVLKDIYSGKPYRVLSEDILNKITATPLSSSGQNNTIMTLIEAHQYILASFYNEIGIAGQWNMKRERVNTAETELMTGSLDVSVYNMIKNLKDAVEKINELFGTDIKVELNEEVITSDEDRPTTTDADGELQTDGVEEDKTETVEVNDSTEGEEGGEDE